MVGVRDLAAIFDAATLRDAAGEPARSPKILLSGDRRQLAAVATCRPATASLIYSTLFERLERGISMRHRTDEWRKFGYSLDSFENALKNLKYHSVFEPVTEPQGPYTVGFFTMRAGASNAVSATGIQDILNNLGAPHGTELLLPSVLPNFPELPEAPRRPDGETNQYIDRRHRAVTKARDLREAFLEIERKDHAMLESLSSGYEEGNEKYVGFLAALSLKRHFLSVALQKPSECHYEAATRILLCEIEIPDFAALRITKLRGKSYSDWVDVTTAEKKRLCETLVYALCIRAAYLTAQSDFGNFIDTIAVNALQSWFDPATGAPKSGTIASLQARKEDLLALQPGRFDAKSCFSPEGDQHPLGDARCSDPAHLRPRQKRPSHRRESRCGRVPYSRGKFGFDSVGRL
jgi:hypothetical protein